MFGKKIKLIVNGVLVTSLFLIFEACTTPKQTLLEGDLLYKQGKVAEAKSKVGPLLEKTSDETFPLFQLTNGYILFDQGNYLAGTELLKSGGDNMEVDLGAGTTITDFIGSESNIHYRGNIHERVLAKYYLGLGYFLIGDYDNASRAFKQAIERDINKTESKTNTFACVNFLLGESFMRIKDYENASVAFKNVVTLNPKFEFAMYKLAYSLHKQNRKDEAQDAYNQYKTLVGTNKALDLDGSDSYVFLVVDAGFGPTLNPDMLTGQFASYSEYPYQERKLKINDVLISKESEIGENIYVQAVSEANLVGDASKKLASIALKKAVSYIPMVGGLLGGSTAADTRKWEILPGEIHFAYLPAEKGTQDITMNFFNKDGVILKDYEQSYYYLPSDIEGKNKVVYIRSTFQKHNQNTNK